MDPVSLIRSCVIIVHIIVQIENDAKYNSIELKRLFNRVKALEQPLTILSKKQSNDLTSRHDALNNVLSTLNDVEEFLMKHQNDNAFDKFTNAAMHGNTQIVNLNLRIDQCLNVLELAVTTSITQQVDDVNRKLDLLLQVSQQLKLNNINNNNNNNVSTSSMPISNVDNDNQINISTIDSTLQQQQQAVLLSPNNNNFSTCNNNPQSSSTSTIASNVDSSFQQPQPLIYSAVTVTSTAISTTDSNNNNDDMRSFNLQTISSTSSFYDPNIVSTQQPIQTISSTSSFYDPNIVSAQQSISYSSQLSSSPSQCPVQYQDSILQHQDYNVQHQDLNVQPTSQYQDSTSFLYQNQPQYSLSQSNLSPSQGYTTQNTIEPALSSFHYLSSPQSQSTTSYSPPTPIYLSSTIQYQDSNNNEQHTKNLPPFPPQQQHQQHQYDQVIYMNSTPSQSQQLPTPPLQLQQTNYHLQQYQQNENETDDYYQNLDKSSGSGCGCIIS